MSTMIEVDDNMLERALNASVSSWGHRELDEWDHHDVERMRAILTAALTVEEERTYPHPSEIGDTITSVTVREDYDWGDGHYSKMVYDGEYWCSNGRTYLPERLIRYTHDSGTYSGKTVECNSRGEMVEVRS